MEPPAHALRKPIADLVNQGRMVEAKALCATARSEFQVDPWMATIQGYILLMLGDSQAALQVAAEALALGSDDPLAVLVLGVAHRNRGRHAEAAEKLLMAARLWPDRLDVATMAIEEAAAAHGAESATEVYREVFARLPDHSLTILQARLQFDAGLDTGLPDGVVSAPVMSVLGWMERTGTTPEFVGAQEVIQLEEPPIFGEPNQARFKGSVPGYTPSRPHP